MRIDSFAALAREAGSKPALVIGEAVCSYAELFEGTQRWSSVLAQSALGSGATVGLSGESCPEMIMLLLALLQGDHVAVPFLSSSEHESRHAWHTADVAGVYHFDASGAARWDARDTAPPHALIAQLRERGKPGLILFTSGSSGVSKGALHDFSRIWSHCGRTERKPATALVFLTIDHIGGINTLLHILLGGGTAVFPAARTVEAVCAAIQAHRVELLPTTPTFLNMFLLSSQRDRFDLGSLQLITYGTEPMPPSTLLGLKQVLPQVRCKQTYGMTETGILPTRSESDESIWLKLGGPGFDTRIVDGVLWVRAGTSMLGYLNAPSPFDADGWLNTGDLVETRDGHVRILGRESEVINVAGEKVSPPEIEDVILQVDNVEDVIVSAKPSAVTGQVVIATVRIRAPEDHRSVSLRIRRHCQAQLSAYKVPALITVTEAELYSRRFKKIRRLETLAAGKQESDRVE